MLGDIQGRGDLQSRMLAAKPHLQRQSGPLGQSAKTIAKVVQYGFSILIADPADPLLIELLNVLHGSNAAGPSLVRDEQVQRGLSQVGIGRGGASAAGRPPEDGPEGFLL